MRRSMYWRAAICVAVVFGGGSISPTDLGFIGVSPAEAKAYYTRKRVDGKWVTGRFAKRSAAKKQVASVSRSAKRAKAVASDEADAAPAANRVAALSAPKAAPAQTAVGAQAAPRAAASAASLSEDDRLNKLREALRARANALTTGSITAPKAPEPQSVSLDFRSGTKTTIFSDGTLITEPFDVGSLKGLAAAFPGPKPAWNESAAGARPNP